jgi:cell division septation protein DedD
MNPHKAVIFGTAALFAVSVITLPILLKNAHTPLDLTNINQMDRSAAANLMWFAGHETNNFSEWFTSTYSTTEGNEGGIYNTNTGKATISTDVAHSGTHALKMNINSPNNGSPQGARVFRWQESRTKQPLYYSVWYYIPQQYKPQNWWDVLEFKSRNATRNDAFWQLNIGNRTDGSMNFYLYNWVNSKSFTQNIANIPVGKWFNVEIYYQQAADNTGKITVWQDGVQIFDQTGVTTMFADAIESANFAVTNYTDNITPANTTIYVDDIKISQNRINDTSAPGATITPVASASATPKPTATPLTTTNPSPTVATATFTISTITAQSTSPGEETIAWTTSQPAIGKVIYGTASNNLNYLAVANTDYTTNHTVKIQGLQNNTRYFYQIISQNTQGQEVKSSIRNFRVRYK